MKRTALLDLLAAAACRGEAPRTAPNAELDHLVDSLSPIVEQATGLRIDHYAEIGFSGFVGAVDAVGGVELCVPQAIKDPKAALNIKAGCQELDGATALGYVRTRATAGSDFDRVERQRAFLSALVKKSTSPATLVNPFRMIPLTSAVTAAIISIQFTIGT